jgi:hypothetical protein
MRAVNAFARGKPCKTMECIDVVSCTQPEFAAHVRSTLVRPEFCFRIKFHKPLAKYDLKEPVSAREALHYTNIFAVSTISRFDVI